jgi:hypothetical protein
VTVFHEAHVLTPVTVASAAPTVGADQ